MKCKNCGYENANGEIYCINCGAKNIIPEVSKDNKVKVVFACKAYFAAVKGIAKFKLNDLSFDVWPNSNITKYLPPGLYHLQASYRLDNLTYGSVTQQISIEGNVVITYTPPVIAVGKGKFTIDSN